MVIHPEVGGGLDEAADAAREAVSEAQKALRAAALRCREVAWQLKQEGFSGRDIAVILRRALERRRAQALGARHAPQRLADILLHEEHDEPCRQQFAEQTVDATQPSLTLRS